MSLRTYQAKRIITGAVLGAGLVLLLFATARSEEAPASFKLTLTLQELNIVVAALQKAPIAFETVSPVRETIIKQYNAQLPKPADTKKPDDKPVPPAVP